MHVLIMQPATLRKSCTTITMFQLERVADHLLDVTLLHNELQMKQLHLNQPHYARAHDPVFSHWFYLYVAPFIQSTPDVSLKASSTVLLSW